MGPSSPVRCYSNAMENYNDFLYFFKQKKKLDSILENGCRWVIHIQFWIHIHLFNIQSTKSREKRKENTNDGTLQQLKLIIHWNETLTTRDFGGNVDSEGKNQISHIPEYGARNWESFSCMEQKRL